MFSLIYNLLERLCIVCGAFVFSQIPQGIHQYEAVLKGRVMELSYQIQTLESLAGRGQMTLPMYIEKLLNFSDADVSRQGEYLDSLLRRYETYSAALQEMRDASPLIKPFAFLHHLNLETLSQVLREFNPALLLTSEVCTYIICGMLFGWFFSRMLRRFFKVLRPRRLA